VVGIFSRLHDNLTLTIKTAAAMDVHEGRDMNKLMVMVMVVIMMIIESVVRVDRVNHILITHDTSHEVAKTNLQSMASRERRIILLLL